MRRAAAFLTVCLLAGIGCRGGVAQERYDAAGVAPPGPSTAVRVPAAPAPVAEPIASEVDVPWTLALLSDAYRQPGEARGDLGVDEPVPEDESADLEVAFEHDQPHEKPATSAKSCSGVVKGRS